MFCFINILNIFFSFVTCSMHKNPHQNAGNGIKETLFFKIFLESMPWTSLEALAPSAQVGQIRVCSPKFLSPYAYGDLMNVMYSKSVGHEGDKLHEEECCGCINHS